MGCVSSKGFRRSPGRVSWYSPLSRNVSAASTNQRLADDGEYNPIVASASISYEALNTETYKGSFLNMRSRAKRYKTIKPQAELEESFRFTSHLDANHKEACASTKPRMCQEEAKRLLMNTGSEGCPRMRNVSKCPDVEVIDTWELMEGLEGSAKDATSSLQIRSHGKLSIPNKQLSSGKLQGSTNEPMGEIDSPVWKKYYMQEDELVSMDFSFDQNLHTPPMGSPFNESPRRVHTPPIGSPFCESPGWAHTPPSGSPFNRSPRRALSRGSPIDREDARSVSSIELLDASTIGLKFFLSPANSSFHPSPVTQKEGTHSATRRSFDGNTRSSHIANASFDVNYGHLCAYFDDAKSPYRSPNMTRHSSKKPSTENVYGCGSPLFDPSLMATFEQALKATTEATSHDEWLQFSTDGSTVLSSSSAETQASFDTTSDAESLPLWQNREKLSSKVMPINEKKVTMKKDLASYDLKCPPRGEGKIVLYFTSLRGIRKTFEDCCNLRLILRGIGAQVDERDVWMHSNFKSELMDVLSGTAKGVPSQVPQLFIKGRHIGGAEEVQQLHEGGILACLMDGLALGVIHNVCDGCGDARFLPCFTCSGSRKVIDEEDDKVLRCRDCNENGLIMCPMCIM